MISFFRFSPSRLALVYIALSVLTLALFAIPLWYAWRVNLSTFREYVQGEEMQRLALVFDGEGAKGLATAMESQVRKLARRQKLCIRRPFETTARRQFGRVASRGPRRTRNIRTGHRPGRRIDHAGGCLACDFAGRIPPLDGP